MAIGPIETVRVFVPDLQPVRAFFEGKLGLKVSVDGPEFIVFHTGGASLVVEIADPGNGSENALVGRFTGVSFVVADIQAAVGELEAAGVRFDGAIEAQDWGASLAHFFDPANNVFTLIEMPSG